jgi:hypothetical protein
MCAAAPPPGPEDLRHRDHADRPACTGLLLQRHVVRSLRSRLCRILRHLLVAQLVGDTAAIYRDLGDGPSYGSTTVASGTVNTQRLIPLDGAASKTASSRGLETRKAQLRIQVVP